MMTAQRKIRREPGVDQASTHASRVPSKRPPRAPRLTHADARLIPDLPSTDGPDSAGQATSTEHIVAAVTQAIVEHRLQPGAKLVEQKIADRFGVSRTIVRQAMFRLSELKLVRMEPARGAFVAAPSITEAREVFAVRRMVESQMLRELVARIKPAHIKALKAHLKAEKDAVTRIDVASRTRLLFDFHVRMAQVLGNQVLVDLLQELVSRCSLITLMYQSADDAQASHAEHAALLKAIEARNAELAVNLLQAHLDTVEHQLTEQPRASGLPVEQALQA
jgi:DNA-binding GntR family transcriptional regulator